MGVLFDECQHVLSVIDARGLDVFKTRGAINLQVGYLVTLVHKDDPDDPEKIAALRKAAKDVLDLDLGS